MSIDAEKRSDSGEAYPFDWSDVEIAGRPMRVKIGHVRLCASRTLLVPAYSRETQEMLFGAHARVFAFSEFAN